MPGAVSTAEDRTAIADLLARYAVGCDRRDFAAVAACFTPDARAEYSGVRLERGVSHIVAHLEQLAGFAATQHVIGTHTLDVTGDGATSTSYAVAHLVRAVDDGHELVHRGVSYDDRLVRTPHGWRIAERVHRVLWSSREPTTWPVPTLR
jgi:ketosteroid isomerase-like protein